MNKVDLLIEEGLKYYNLQRSPLPPPLFELPPHEPVDAALERNQASIVYSYQPESPKNKLLYSPTTEPLLGKIQQKYLQEIEQKDEIIKQLQEEIEELSYEKLDGEVLESELLEEKLINKKVEDSTEQVKNENKAERIEEAIEEDDEFYIKKLRFGKQIERAKEKEENLQRQIEAYLGQEFSSLQAAVYILFDIQ